MRWILLLAVTVAGAGCPSDARPTPTGTTCDNPDPVNGTTTLTWDNFGMAFMFKYCTNCHSSQLAINQRNGAPLFHDFDTLLGVLEVANHIDEQAGWGPKAKNSFMPGGGTGGRCPSQPGGSLDENCVQPTDQERTDLAQWLACEQKRMHNFNVDAGVDAP